MDVYLYRIPQCSNGDHNDGYEDGQGLEEAEDAVNGQVFVAEWNVGGSFGVVGPNGQPEVAENVEELKWKSTYS